MDILFKSKNKNNMIIGNGMLSQYIKSIDTNNAIFICSGVSNSSTTDNKSFCREKKVLLKIPKERLVVYTSSLSVELGNTPYQLHKAHMEDLIANNFHKFLILRIGNLIGKNQKPYQFFPSMIKQIKSGLVDIKTCKRDLLTCHYYAKIIKDLLIQNKTGIFKVCTPNPPWVKDIVNELELYLGQSYKKNIINITEHDIYKSDIPIKYDYKNMIKEYFYD